MRTIIDVPKNIIEELDRLGKQHRISRAAVVRDALNQYLRSRTPDSDAGAFGLWKDRDLDGVAFQEELRSEWNDRS